MRHGRLVLPLRRDGRLLDPQAAGVPRGRARARARDPSGGAPPQAPRGAVVSELWLSDRAHVPAVSQLPRPGQGPLRVVREADRPALDDLPVLRDASAPGGPPAAPDARGATPRSGCRARRPAALPAEARAAPGRPPARSGPRGRPQAASPGRGRPRVGTPPPPLARPPRVPRPPAPSSARPGRDAPRRARPPRRRTRARTALVPPPRPDAL